MKKKMIVITENQDKRIKSASNNTGLSQSEICRRAIDNYFKSKVKQKS